MQDSLFMARILPMLVTANINHLQNKERFEWQTPIKITPTIWSQFFPKSTSFQEVVDEFIKILTVPFKLTTPNGSFMYFNLVDKVTPLEEENSVLIYMNAVYKKISFGNFDEVYSEF